jgi:hypothetical protein
VAWGEIASTIGNLANEGAEVYAKLEEAKAKRKAAKAGSRPEVVFAPPATSIGQQSCCGPFGLSTSTLLLVGVAAYFLLRKR